MPAAANRPDAQGGPDFADPDYDLAVDWLAAHAAIDKAQAEYEDPAQPPCILIVNGSSRASIPAPARCRKAGG